MCCPVGRACCSLFSGGPDEARADIAIADIRSGRHRTLTRGTHGLYAESGHLLYVDVEGTLFAAPFDKNEMALTGEAPEWSMGYGAPVLGGRT